MRVIRDNPGGQLLRSSVVTIGNFDGLHCGHQALIRHCESLAGDERPIAVVTFEPLPQAWFNPETAPARLMSVRQKLDYLACEAIDLVWLMRFNQSLAGMDADSFVRTVLVETLAAGDVVVGEDFRYGKGRQGDIESLRASGEKLGFGCTRFRCWRSTTAGHQVPTSVNVLLQVTWTRRSNCWAGLTV